jgi:hypothetical protein
MKHGGSTLSAHYGFPRSTEVRWLKMTVLVRKHKNRKCLDQLNNYHVLKEDPAAWISISFSISCRFHGVSYEIHFQRTQEIFTRAGEMLLYRNKEEIML